MDVEINYAQCLSDNVQAEPTINANQSDLKK